jgi:hypothetical protein
MLCFHLACYVVNLSESSLLFLVLHRPHVNVAYLRVVTYASGNGMSFGTSLFIRVTHCASLCLGTRDLALSH